MKAYERLLKYVVVRTPSDENSETVPSSVCQFDLARLLEAEMKDLGLTDVVGLRQGKQVAFEIDETNGITCILSGDTDEEQSEKASLLFLTMEAGLRSIQASYRSALKIRHREV